MTVGDVTVTPPSEVAPAPTALKPAVVATQPASVAAGADDVCGCTASRALVTLPSENIWKTRSSLNVCTLPRSMTAIPTAAAPRPLVRHVMPLSTVVLVLVLASFVVGAWSQRVPAGFHASAQVEASSELY